MKRLIASLVVSLGLVFAQLGSVAAAPARFWQLDMFDPAASTVNRTINVEYKVLSTIESDTFEVKLFQNEVELGTQNAASANGGGNSGVFSVNIPATGTYTYKVTARNNADASTQSESKNVQVVDGPAPTVTTVFTNTGGANNAVAGGQGQGAGGGGTGAGAGGAGVGAQGGAGQAANGEGQVEGADTDEGEVDGGAASDSQKPGDVLGSAAQATRSNSGRNVIIGVLVLGALGGAYYWFTIRPRNSA